MTSNLRDALNDAILDELPAALGRIVHCLMQLSDEQIWSRPRADMNSIGNLVLHLCGNVQQMIGAGIDGAPDDRDRPAEFAERGPIPGEELLGKLLTTVQRARIAILNASDETLCATIPVKRYEYTGIQAVIRCIAHFRGHAQEIIHQTRMILGDKYEFAGPK